MGIVALMTRARAPQATSHAPNRMRRYSHTREAPTPLQHAETRRMGHLNGECEMTANATGTRSAASIRRRSAAIDRRAAALEAARQLLQIECSHPNATKEYRGSTGNYDPSCDCYWINWDCPDCGKHWRTGQ